jgi:hypothetical protein
VNPRPSVNPSVRSYYSLVLSSPIHRAATFTAERKNVLRVRAGGERTPQSHRLRATHVQQSAMSARCSEQQNVPSTGFGVLRRFRRSRTPAGIRRSTARIDGGTGAGSASWRPEGRGRVF